MELLLHLSFQNALHEMAQSIETKGAKSLLHVPFKKGADAVSY